MSKDVIPTLTPTPGGTRRSVAVVLATVLTVPAVVLTGQVPAQAAGSAPIFTSASTNTSQAVDPGASFAPMMAQDGDQDDLTYSASGTLPAGITLDPDTGALVGTATTAFAGTVQIMVSDGDLTATTQLALTVNDLPPVFGDTRQDVIPGDVLAQLTASDPNGTPVTLEVENTLGNHLPAGITLLNGVLTGTVTDEGTTTTRIVATSEGTSVTGVLTVTVTNPFAPISYVADYNTQSFIHWFDASTTISVVTQPMHGSVQLVSSPDGTDLLYTPAQGYIGKDAFGYKVQKSGGPLSAEKTLPISVSALAAERADTLIDTPVTIRVLDNDSPGLDRDTLAVLGTPFAGGTVTIQGDAVRFTPKAGFSGHDGFTYVVQDQFQHIHYSSVSIYVNAVANHDLVSTAYATPVTIAVLDNDLGLFVAESVDTTTPAHGTVALTGDGKVVYTPSPGFSGVDTFAYSVQDLKGWRSVSAQVTVNVAADDLVTSPVDAEPVAAPVAPPVPTPPATPVTALAPVKPGVPSPGTVAVAKPAVTVTAKAALPVSGVIANVRSGTKVYVELRQRNGRWVAMGASTTDGKGKFSVTLKAPKSKGAYSYRVVAPSTGTSQAFTVTVK